MSKIFFDRFYPNTEPNIIDMTTFCKVTLIAVSSLSLIKNPDYITILQMILVCGTRCIKKLKIQENKNSLNSHFKHVVFQFAYNVMINIIYNNYILNKVICLR